MIWFEIHGQWIGVNGDSEGTNRRNDRPPGRTSSPGSAWRAAKGAARVDCDAAATLPTQSHSVVAAGTRGGDSRAGKEEAKREAIGEAIGFQSRSTRPLVKHVARPTAPQALRASPSQGESRNDGFMSGSQGHN